MPDLEEQLRAYGTVLDRADAFERAADVVVRPMRRRSFVVGVALVVAVVAVVAITVRAARSTSSPRPKIVTPGPELSSTTALSAPAVTATARPDSLQVVAQFGVTDPAPHPLAFAAGRMWVARRTPGQSGPVVIDGYEPSSAHLDKTISVPQNEVFAIAGQGDTLWISGSDDVLGAGITLPNAIVSRVDARSGKVLFTTTLRGTPCACAVVAGPAGVWLVGGSDAIRLSPVDGHEITDVAIEATATAAIESRGRLLVGRDDGAIEVIDPATNTVERTIPTPVVGDPPVEWVKAMSPASVPAIGSDPPIDALVARRNGAVSVLARGGSQAGEVDAADFEPSSIVNVGPTAWVFGENRLFVTTTHAVVSKEFRYADGQLISATGPADAGSHFGDALAADGTVWCVVQQGDGSYTIALLTAPTPFPFG
jgi:hypothetical protein